jgi:LPS-assembly protein
MDNGRKIKAICVQALIFTALILSVTFNSQANYSHRHGFYKILTALLDTVPILAGKMDTTLKNDTSLKDTSLRDTVVQQTDTIHLKVSKDSLDAPISYSASDSVVLDMPTKKITLYNKANTKYKDISLDAYKIELDQPNQIIVATFTRDTAGKIIGEPKMVEKENTMESDSLTYNMKNQKGLTKNTFTQSGEMYVHGDVMKKVSENVYFGLRGRFTTCNYDPPHFAFIANKMKLVNKKFAITGPVHPEFEGVPIPLYIPFGYFPLSQGRHSGLLPPTFDASPQFGIGLEGLGYYKVLSDNFDVTVRTNLYSYGGWNLYFTPEYKVRYRYSGRLSFTLQNTKILSTTGQTEFDDTRTFQFSWSHIVDSKARPGTNFSANVNISSQKFNQYVYNNPTLNYTNQLSSSISYSKTWEGKYNLTVNANHSQNNETGLIQINLPNIGFTATTIYPFQQKDFVGTPKWYEKLGIGLSTSITNQASIYDSLFSIHKLLDTFQWGAQHIIPITLSLPPLFGNALQVSPGISLQERWYSRKLFRRWDSTAKKLDSTFQSGFFTANDASFSLNLSTAIFGTFNHFGKNSSIVGIRHVIRPTIGISYKPDLAKPYYYSSQADSTGRLFRFSEFDGSSYGPFGEGRFGGISFGLDNNIEMKVRSKTDTSNGGTKKVKLIDGFGVTSSYNYLADSFKLAPFNLYLRSTLFGNINITGGATVDPYATDSMGFRKNILVWDQPGKKFSVGRLTTGTLAVSTSFKSKPKDEKKAEADKQAQSDQLPMTPEEQQEELNYIRSHPAEFADFNIAWSINLSFSLNFNKVLKPDYSGYMTVFNSSLNWNGDFNLTPEWKVGLSSYYDVKNEKIQSLTMSLSRNMHCWQMAINVTPVGLYRSFSVTLSPKSAILQDLKVNRTRSFPGGD